MGKKQLLEAYATTPTFAATDKEAQKTWKQPGSRRSRKKTADDSAVKIGHLDIARKVLEFYEDGNLCFIHSRLYRWTGKFWAVCDDHEIRQRIISTFESLKMSVKVTANSVDSVLKLVRSESFNPSIQFNAQADFITCANGTLHFANDSWTLKEHKREDYRTSFIPVEYDPKATCLRFRQFLDEIFVNDTDKAEKIKTIQQFLGYSLTTSCKHEMYFILIGEGSNGKSVLLYVVEGLVGPDNIAGVDPSQFGNKFQRAHLRGKLVNSITELKQGLELDDAALKSIVSGELCTAEEKYRDPFNFRPYAKCWFGTNHLPNTRDVSYAFFRRGIIIEFNRKFDEQTGKDPDLRHRLIKELPGILNFALAGLKSLLEERYFTEPASSRAAKENWRMESDQVMQFMRECCKTGSYLLINVSELYSKYLQWAQKAGINKTFTKNNFGRRLRSMGIKGKDGTNGIRQYEGVEIDYNKWHIIMN